MEATIKTGTEDSYSRVDYQQIGKVGKYAVMIDTIIEWMEDKGIKAGVSRYSRYKKYIEDFKLKPQDSKEPKRIILLSELECLYEKSDNSLREIMQMISVYRAFRDEQSEGFVERLKKAVSGADFFTGEANDQGRDFLYELVVAAWFNEMGYCISFDSDKNTDVVGKRGNIEIFVECKRLKSSNRYEENYRKGCKQLKQISNNEVIKLVYIDIYNCIRNSIRPYEYQSVIDVKNSVEKGIVKEFLKPNEHTTNKVLAEFKNYVDGVVFTNIGNYGVNSVLGIEIEYYRGIKVILNKDISEERFELIETALQK